MANSEHKYAPDKKPSEQPGTVLFIFDTATVPIESFKEKLRAQTTGNKSKRNLLERKLNDEKKEEKIALQEGGKFSLICKKHYQQYHSEYDKLRVDHISSYLNNAKVKREKIYTNIVSHIKNAEPHESCDWMAELTALSAIRFDGQRDLISISVNTNPEEYSKKLVAKKIKKIKAELNENRRFQEKLGKKKDLLIKKAVLEDRSDSIDYIDDAIKILDAELAIISNLQDREFELTKELRDYEDERIRERWVAQATHFLCLKNPSSTLDDKINSMATYLKSIELSPDKIRELEENVRATVNKAEKEFFSLQQAMDNEIEKEAFEGVLCYWAEQHRSNLDLQFLNEKLADKTLVKDRILQWLINKNPQKEDRRFLIKFTIQLLKSYQEPENINILLESISCMLLGKNGNMSLKNYLLNQYNNGKIEYLTSLDWEKEIPFSLKFQIKFYELYNPNNVLRSNLKAFFGFSSKGNFYNNIEAFLFPVTLIKNIAKLVTEFLPAAMADHCKSSGWSYFFGAIHFLTKRITSPWRSAKETYYERGPILATINLIISALGIAVTLGWALAPALLGVSFTLTSILAIGVGVMVALPARSALKSATEYSPPTSTAQILGVTGVSRVGEERQELKSENLPEKEHEKPIIAPVPLRYTPISTSSSSAAPAPRPKRDT